MASLKLYWQSVQNAVSYTVYYRTTSGVTPENGTPIAGITGISYNHENLLQETTYYYTVVAFDRVGVASEPSEEFSAIAAVVLGIRIRPSSSQIQIDGEEQFQAVLLYSDGFEVDITTEATWDTDDHDVATINESGLLTALDIGTTAITATYDIYERTAEVEVVDGDD